MIVLISSAGEEIYKQFVLRVLCYPFGHILPDVPYSLDRVASPFNSKPTDLVNEKDAVIVLVDYVKVRNGAESLKPIFLPLRLATITRASRFAGKLLLDVRLGNYCYYDDEIRKGYDDQNDEVTTRTWSVVIRSAGNSPRPMPRIPGKPIDPSDRTSWASTGKFVLKIHNEEIDLRVLSSEERVRDECEDWKSIVDMITQRGQFEDKLFYQISGLRQSEAGSRAFRDKNDIKSTTLVDRSVYSMTAGDSAELVLHFYHGKKRERDEKKVLNVTTDDAYLVTLGTTAIDVYSSQTSGKVEQLRLISRPQLSRQFTRVRIGENADPPALATTELYIRLQPKRLYITAILIAFVLGTFLNNLPEHVRWIWLWKVFGTALMAGAFWLAFSKFPSKE